MSGCGRMEIEVDGIRDTEMIFYSSSWKDLLLFACSGLYQGDIASMQVAVDVQLVAH